MLTARPASHSGNDACADAATASPHGVDTRACTALTDSRDRGHASQERLIRFAEAAENKVPLVRIHSECVTGDVFGSLR